MGKEYLENCLEIVNSDVLIEMLLDMLEEREIRQAIGQMKMDEILSREG